MVPDLHEHTDTISAVSGRPRPRRQAPWSPRTAHRPVPARTDALLGGPTAPYGHPEQPPPKEYPIPKQTRCLRSLP
eukprot:7006712-Prymnesium_polylepis.1